MIREGLAAAAAVAVASAAALTGTAVANGGRSDDDKATSASIAQASGHKAKNVIFFLGDGMGTQEITAARYYQGVRNKLNVDRLPFTGFQTTWSVKPAAQAPYLPDYDPDSASTATMWATGRKTLDERLSQGPSSAIDVPGQNYRTVLEQAQRQGKKTGNVSTAEITDATPAALNSHISLRGCQGPADAATLCPKETKAVGGLGSIAEQTVDHKVDVVLGGGRARFTQPITAGPDAGRNVIESAQRQGYRYVSSAAELTTVRPGRPVLGLFTTSTMSVEWSGPAASLGKGNTPVACTENQRPANEPSLAATTSTAIRLLESSRKGLFLQVEGASIDKQDHATNACGQIGETVAFDRAIGVALDYQRTHPDTLILVTADHAHTSQIVSEDASGGGLPTGYSTNVLTRDGQTLTLTYGTAGYAAGGAPASTPPSQQHTGAVVPIWGKGPGALDILGTRDHTELFKILGG
jgi:alkaline phosphatase